MREEQPDGYLLENASFAQHMVIFELLQIWQTPTLFMTQSES